MLPSATDLARAFDRQPLQLTPLDAVDQLLAHIERCEPHLQAWQDLTSFDPRQVAEGHTAALRAGHRIGPFHGVPFALKDIVDVAGLPTTAGSAALADRVAPATATIARRLIAAGGILVGKTRTVELALGGWGTNQHFGMPRNPWDADGRRAPGGSSSGSGVAVASGMVPCAIGTDTGGSVRLPASFCGLVGLKTTEGLLPTDGIVPLSHSLDTPGPMARTVADTALMFDVLRGRSPVAIDADWRSQTGLYRPPRDDLRHIRLGVLDDRDRGACTPGVLRSYDRAIETLADLGARLEPFTTPLSYDAMKDLAFVVIAAEAWYHHGALFGDPDAPLDEDVRARGVMGRDITAQRYIGAQLDRRRHRRDLLAAMGDLDALVLPGTPAVAPLEDEIDQVDTPAHFTRAANLLALSALSVPIGPADHGLPAGLQLVGRGDDEEALLALGRAYEQARGSLPDPPLG